MAFKYNSIGGSVWTPDDLPPVQKPQQGPQSMQTMQTMTAPAGPAEGSAENPMKPIGYSYDPTTAQTTPFNSSPQSMTALYQTTTGAGGQASTASGSTPGSVSSGAYEGQQQSQLDALLKQQQMDHSAKLQAEAEKRRLGYVSTITGSQSPQVGPQGGPAFDENAARTAAFARAKEQAGQTALASMKSLQDVMSESGKTGSSMESEGIAGIVGGGAGRINDFTRSQLITDLNRAGEIADNNTKNAITQRGQNMSQIPSLLQLISATGGAY